jgi:hypothetical protein
MLPHCCHSIATRNVLSRNYCVSDWKGTNPRISITPLVAAWTSACIDALPLGYGKRCAHGAAVEVCGSAGERVLRVLHSLYKRQLVAPKTFSSARQIPLGDVPANALASHREASSFIGPEDFVFCGQDGMPLNPDVLRKDVLYPALDRLNIPRPKGAGGFHCFRHSAASFINAETGNLKIIQKYLGHSNGSTTADVYTHVSEAVEREAAVALERSIFGSCSRFVCDFNNKSNVFPFRK